MYQVHFSSNQYFVRHMTMQTSLFQQTVVRAKYPRTLCQKIDNYFHKDYGMKFILEALESKAGETCTFKITVVDKAPTPGSYVGTNVGFVGVYNTREQLLDALEPYLQMEETR